MKRLGMGRYEVSTAGGESVRAFVPAPLPPQHPALKLDDLQHELEQAQLALGRMDGVSTLLPDRQLFLYMYIRKDAVLSSQIEGTQSSLSDLLLFELDAAPGVPLDDVIEVSSYVAAMNRGLTLLREELPVCNRLIREIHGFLLARGRGSARDPGNFRRSQNWIGGSRPGNAVYVPPPAQLVQKCMSDLERFLNAEHPLPVLVQAGLAHAQFESIHSFLDGNGRVGRLLITFLLCQHGVLREPLLYLSLYFKQHQDEYYRHLSAVRESGDWAAWLAFFLSGVRETAEGAVETARRLLGLFDADRARIQRGGRCRISVARASSLDGAPHHVARRGGPEVGTLVSDRVLSNEAARRSRYRGRTHRQEA